MYPTPDLIHLAYGSSEGITPLNAFDNALLAAGVHNLNLIQVSSIVPRDARFGDLPSGLPVGMLTPTVYSHISSNVSGEIISACVGAGIGTEGGTLFEYHHRGRGDDAEDVVRKMIDEGFRVRGWTLDRVLFATAEHKVERTGCAVAAAVLLMDGDGTSVSNPRGEVTR